MGDSEDQRKPGMPVWQKTDEIDKTDARPENDNNAATLEQARKFLQDEHVQQESSERKAEFLRSKGIAHHDIEKLVEEVSQAPQSEEQDAETIPNAREYQGPKEYQPPETQKAERRAEERGDHTPIITYPEFLIKRPRPPPLVTVNGFLNTLYTFAGLSAAVYGTSKYVVEPLVESLTEARLSFHETAKEDLAKLVGRLEGAVSEIPPVKKADALVHGAEGDDDGGTYDDPSELFHRDIGVQTSLPASPAGALSLSRRLSQQDAEKPVQEQTRRVQELAASVKSLSDSFATQSEGYEDAKRVLDAFAEDLDKLTYPPSDFVGGFSLYGHASKNEPDDEIKRAKENIRRVKGVLLSARSFPGSVR